MVSYTNFSDPYLAGGPDPWNVEGDFSESCESVDI